ncbi:MAG: hypothetical protein JWP97_1190 [Labilithrix sp.]|nr:hypothetical protein [Labilithrix sp.]
MTDAAASPPLTPEDLAARMNASRDGWNQAMGLRFVRVGADEVVAEIDVGPQHLQPYGVVHGGVHAGLIETVTSVGAAVYAMRQGRGVVGLENHTSFLHAVRTGRLTVTARPLARGRSTQVWEATVADEQGRAAASGRVRLFALDPGASIGGGEVKVEVG